MATTVTYEQLANHYFGIGVALVATTLIAGVLLQYVRRIRNVKTFLRSNFSVLKTNNVLAIIGTILYYLFLALPAILLMIWVILLLANSGANPALPVLFTSLFIFGLFIPTSAAMFYYKILVLFVLFLLAEILTMSLSWDNDNVNSFFALTAVLMAINGIFASISLWLMDGNCWSLPWALPADLKKEVMQHFQIWEEEANPPNIVSGGLYYEISTRKITRVIIIIVLQVLGLLTLMTYTLVVYFRTNFGPIGLINSICVVSTDLVVFMLIYMTKESNINPFFNSLTGMMVRVCLVAFAGDLWFVGYCLLFILLIGYITVLIINRHYPTFEKIPNMSAQKINIFKLPEVAAMFLMAMFGALIFYVGSDSITTLQITSVQIQTTSYPFWTIGVASILLSFSFMFYMISLRIIQRSQEKIRSITKYYMGFEACGEYYMYLFFSYAFLVVLGVYMFFQVRNHIIWAACVFMPLFYQSFIIFYASWRENDFLLFGDVAVYNKKLKKRVERNKRIEDNRMSVIKGLKDKGGEVGESSKMNLMEGAEVESNFMVERDDRSQYQDWIGDHNLMTALREDLMLPTDKSILISMPLMAISLIGFCSAYWFSQFDHTAFTMTAEISFLFLTLVPMKRYFQTLERPHITHIIAFSCGILLNYVYGILSLVLQWNISNLWTLWWSIINVFFLSLYATFALLRDNGISLPTIILTVINVILSFGIGLIVIIAFSQLIVGIVILAVAFYYAYIIGIVYLYLYRNKSLPWIMIPISVGIIIVTCFAIMVYGFVVDTFDNFLGVSITYLVINLMVLLYAAQSLFRSIRSRFDKPNFFSPYGHPVFKYDTQIKSVKDNSQILIIWMTAWFMFYSYTLLLEIFITDVNYGISAGQIFLLISFLTYIYFTTYNTYTAGKESKDITPEILESSWKEILKAKDQLGTTSPSIADINVKLVAYQQMQAAGPDKVNPSDSEGAKKISDPKDIDLFIDDLQEKLEKAIQDEKIQLVNFWIKVNFKVLTIRKKKMLRFTTFIRQSSEFLATIGVNLILDSEIYDLESIYNSAFLEYNAFSPIQRIQFDKEYKQWKIRKEENEKKNQQLNDQHNQQEKKRYEQLRRRLQEPEEDDSGLPIEKMRDSLNKLNLIRATNQAYSDGKFRASNDIIPDNAREDCKGWKRPPAGTVIMKEGKTSMSVRQGYIGDCYLISAIGVLSRDALNNIFGTDSAVEKWENPNGAYMVKFRKFNRNVYIIVDSQFPVGDGGGWLFGRSEDPNEMFVSILEKAYAKLYEGYQNIVGGKVSLALADITGGFPEQIRLKEYQDQNTNDIFDKMVEFKKSGYLMGAGSPENERGDAVDIDGIVQGHAYLVLDVRDLDGNKLIKVRNPHGNQGLESQLDWNDDSPRWNKRLINLLGEEMKEDGAFWLGLEDFVYVFRALYVCRIFNPSIWETVGPLHGEWKGKSAAGLPTKKNPQAKLADNPHYGVTVSRKCTLFVELNQNERDESRRGKNYIFFMVQKADGGRVQSFSMNKLVGKSGAPINSMSVSAEVVLNASNYPYTFSLMAACIDEGAEGSYNLVFYCDDKSMKITPHETFDI